MIIKLNESEQNLLLGGNNEDSTVCLYCIWSLNKISIVTYLNTGLCHCVIKSVYIYIYIYIYE